ncbi:MAG TPA: hemolysin III family protein [Gemmatimonadales bacterium]|nr:hemolysin III family protein [Gemmatimonadales bacterium]
MRQTAGRRSEPAQSLGEEIANSVSHGVGLVAALLAAPVLITAVVRRGSAASVIGTSIFATTVVFLYAASTLYHALPSSRAKRMFRILDYGAVFLLIAGTYTPFTLGVLRGVWGWTLFGLVWSLAVLGIVATALGGLRYPRFTTTVYLGMGWMVLIAIRPLWLRMPLPGLLWLLAGGLAYTVGVRFLTARRLRYSHFVWHLLVLVGTTCHFIAVLSYAA